MKKLSPRASIGQKLLPNFKNSSLAEPCKTVTAISVELQKSWVFTGTQLLKNKRIQNKKEGNRLKNDVWGKGRILKRSIGRTTNHLTIYSPLSLRR